MRSCRDIEGNRFFGNGGTILHIHTIADDFIICCTCEHFLIIIILQMLPSRRMQPMI